MAGRPVSSIEFFPQNPQRAFSQIVKACEEDKNVKQNMVNFASSLLKLLDTPETKSTQTDNTEKSIIESISELTEKSFLLSIKNL